MAGCNGPPADTPAALFEQIPPDRSGIRFANQLTSTARHNIYTDNNFYAGGGVAIGDVSGDGLPDIYLVSNQSSNGLFLNAGGFRFEDVTDRAGVGGSRPWSTGVSLVDINGDGLLDIYVTNSGVDDADGRRNELFVNNGDLTFTEMAEQLGIADRGYSIHAVFFDYDRDGRLDLYVVNNHAAQPIGAYDLARLDRSVPDSKSGDRLYRNTGAGFVDVTREAGVYSSEFSFGFGATVGDFDRDGFADIYVSNDFFERDYFYLNNGDGTFRESLEETFSSISTTSMSGDLADLDNDGLPELYISDMLPEADERLKRITDFIGWDEYRKEVRLGYHRKFARNTLQYNLGSGAFSEIGRFAGIEATDWSWGALIADFDLDGARDVFVANGFYKDVTDKDFLLGMSRRQQEFIRPDRSIDYDALVERTPSTPTSNYLFQNAGGLRFVNRAEPWGVGQPGFSHGAAYGDLDGDGALDLVVNNVNMEPFIYRNRALEADPRRAWLQVRLEGEPPNTIGVGAKVELVSGGRYEYGEQVLQRGFQSSVDPVLHFGLGVGVERVDTLQVLWPDGRVTLLEGVPARQRLVVRQADASLTAPAVLAPALRRGAASAPLLTRVVDDAPTGWRHREPDLDDFDRYPFLFHAPSADGPPVCSGDLTGAGRQDVYVGGGAGQPGLLLLESENGRLRTSKQHALDADGEAADTDCIFFDADGDGRDELYVASGGSRFPAGSRVLADRLYRLERGGRLARDAQALPRPAAGHLPTGTVRAGDVDADGAPDLFVGVRTMPFTRDVAGGYGEPAGGILLRNRGDGRFDDATARLAPGLAADSLHAAGITAAAWGDVDGDDRPDLVIAGEWMPLTLFLNRDGRLERAGPAQAGLGSTAGWWHALSLADLNQDGTLDLVAGNHGLNSRLRASREEPLRMWAGDFGRTGRLVHILARRDGSRHRPLALRHDLLANLPYLAARIPSYAAYSTMTVEDIFSERELASAWHHDVERLESVVGWNDGTGRFRIEPLPAPAQWAPVYAVVARDVDGDGLTDLLLGGNRAHARPQAGPYDAGRGLVLRRTASGAFEAVPARRSGLLVEGDIRSIHALDRPDHTLYIVARNDRELLLYDGAPSAAAALTADQAIP